MDRQLVKLTTYQRWGSCDLPNGDLRKKQCEESVSGQQALEAGASNSVCLLAMKGIYEGVASLQWGFEISGQQSLDWQFMNSICLFHLLVKFGYNKKNKSKTPSNLYTHIHVIISP